MDDDQIMETRLPDWAYKAAGLLLKTIALLAVVGAGYLWVFLGWG